MLEEIAGGRRGRPDPRADRDATPEQIEEAFQEACLKASRGCYGQSIGEVYVWLRNTTTTTLRDMLSQRRRNSSARRYRAGVPRSVGTYDCDGRAPHAPPDVPRCGVISRWREQLIARCFLAGARMFESIQRNLATSPTLKAIENIRCNLARDGSRVTVGGTRRSIVSAGGSYRPDASSSRVVAWSR